MADWAAANSIARECRLTAGTIRPPPLRWPVSGRTLVGPLPLVNEELRRSGEASDRPTSRGPAAVGASSGSKGISRPRAGAGRCDW